MNVSEFKEEVAKLPKWMDNNDVYIMINGKRIKVTEVAIQQISKKSNNPLSPLTINILLIT